jgi:hypothetical protein
MLDKFYRKIVQTAVDTSGLNLEGIVPSDLERSLLYELMHTRVKLEFRTWVSRIAFTFAGGMAVWAYTNLN